MRNLPDLAALFDGGPRRARAHLSDVDRDGDAAALVESDEPAFPAPVKDTIAVRGSGVEKGGVAAQTSPINGVMSNDMRSGIQEAIVEEVLDVVHYDEVSFPDLGVTDYCDAERAGNNCFVESDKISPPSVFQGSNEAMEGPPSFSTELPGAEPSWIRKTFSVYCRLLKNVLTSGTTL